MKFATIAIAALFAVESQAVKVTAGAESKLALRTQIDAAIDDYLSAETSSDAEWGFLKNIVNIDRFFDSGVKA